MNDLRTAAQQALEALEAALSDDQPYIERCKQTITALRAALAEPDWQDLYLKEKQRADMWRDKYESVAGAEQRIHPLAEPVQEPVQCEPQYANEDGWCEWVCPKPVGYLMQCCDCGLIHEVESRVAKYEPLPSEMFEVVDDPDLQAQWRMKRRDDISPKQPPQRPAEPVQEAVAWAPTWAIDRLTGQMGAVADPVTWGVDAPLYVRETRDCVPLYTVPQPAPDDKLREAATQSLKWLNDEQEFADPECGDFRCSDCEVTRARQSVIDALREALEQR